MAAYPSPPEQPSSRVDVRSATRGELLGVAVALMLLLLAAVALPVLAGSLQMSALSSEPELFSETWNPEIPSRRQNIGDPAAPHLDFASILPLALRGFRTWDEFCEENDTWEAACGPLISDQWIQAYPDDEDDYYLVDMPVAGTVSVIVAGYAPTSSDGQLLLYGPATESDKGPPVGHFGDPGHMVMTIGPMEMGARPVLGAGLHQRRLQRRSALFSADDGRAAEPTAQHPFRPFPGPPGDRSGFADGPVVECRRSRWGYRDL